MGEKLTERKIEEAYCKQELTFFLTTQDSGKKDVLGSKEKPGARGEKSLNDAWEMGLSRLFDLPRINETLLQNALPGYTSS